MKKITTSHGILLRKHILADESAILTFLTNQWGKAPVFCAKYETNKKWQQEIDFFRLFELQVFEGQNYRKLRMIETVSVFRSFDKNYESLQKGFDYLGILDRYFWEKKSLDKSAYLELVKMLHYHEASVLWEIYFYIWVFRSNGSLPRFDRVRGKTTFCLDTGRFGTEYGIPLSNEARQLIEFLRRSDWETVSAKSENLSEDLQIEVLEFWKRVLGGRG